MSIHNGLFFTSQNAHAWRLKKPGNRSDCDPNRANTGDVNRSHEGEDTTLTVTDQDQEKPKDEEDEGGLHLPLTTAVDDVSNHSQEGPRWLLLQKTPHMDIWETSKTTSRISFGVSITNN